MLCSPFGNLMLVPLNQWICKTCINLKQKSHLNDKQENHGAAYYRKNSFTRDYFQGALSQN